MTANKMPAAKKAPVPTNPARRVALAHDRQMLKPKSLPASPASAARVAPAVAAADRAKLAAVQAAPAKAPKALGQRAQVEADAARGILPTPPDFTAETHKAYRKKLAELVTFAKAGDIAALKAFEIKPTSTSPKALIRYRDLSIIALTAKKPTAVSAKIRTAVKKGGK